MFSKIIQDPFIDFSLVQSVQNVQESQNILYQVFQKSINDHHTELDNATTRDPLRSCQHIKMKMNRRTKIGRKVCKSKKNKKHSGACYKKNLCGYITKKGIKQFICGTYDKQIAQLCFAENVNIQQAKKFYDNKIQIVTGPSHLLQLFTTEKQQQIPILRVFVKFFTWFLRQRYIRHLFLQGKMELKNVYIEYKNKILLLMAQQYQKKLFQQYIYSSILQTEQFINSVL